MACSNCNGNVSCCNNPCGVTAGNTAACESLPSQIANFTDQFFGGVVKTEIDGVVNWSLPCELDVGLPGNPRAVDEGLACYFLRLFRDGIGGLKGDPGDSGADGTPGNNAYTVVVQGFTQPTLSSPLAQILVVANPVLVAGLYIFVQNSGYYLITDVQPGGIVFATLVSVAANAQGYIVAGSLVVPTGPPSA